MNKIHLLTSVVCIASAAAFQLHAEELKIATAKTSTSADPHFFLMNANDELRHYAFESLVDIDETGTPQPRLAKSWKLLDDKTWEFTLRDDVKFHDGRPFTARDVLYSICRIRDNKTAGSFARYVSQVVSAEMPDPHRLIIKTKAAYPLLLPEFSLWAVVATPEGIGDIDVATEGCGIANYPTNADFDQLKTTIGTGAFAYKSYEVGGVAQFTRFEEYWGEKPAWTSATLAPIEDAAVRTAAFMAGDYQVIQGPSQQATDRIKADENYKVASAPTYDVRFLMFDTAREPSPQITGTDGKNPFKDKRVREAFSLALNRPAIIDKVLNGNGVETANLQGPQTFGFNPDLKPIPYDPARAKELMVEAGYPNGFGVKLSVQTETEASRVGQAMAQMLAQIGVKVELEASPMAVFFQKRGAGELSLYSYTIGARSGEMLTPLKVLLGTPKSHPGFGNINGGGYSNPELDQLLLNAQSEMDDEKRRKLLQEGNRLMAENFPLALVYQRVDTWAYSSRLSYEPSINGYTLARDVEPAQ